MTDKSKSQGGAEITTDSVVVASREQVASELGDETVILNLKNGVYYGLDPIGTEVWRVIQEPRKVLAVRDHLLAAYDVEQDRCEGDLLALLADLSTQGLIEIKDGRSA